MPGSLRSPGPRLETKIVVLRGEKVLLGDDLAATYGVPTRVLNQAVKRNRERFPEDFCFQLTAEEVAALRSQIVISKPGRGGRRYRPWAFTEHGAIMAAAVLNSPRAVEMSIFVVRVFVRLREMAKSHGELAAKVAALERRVAGHDESIRRTLQAIRVLLEPSVKPRRRIGFRRADDA